MNVLADPPSNETPEERDARLWTEYIQGSDIVKDACRLASTEELDMAYRSRSKHHMHWKTAVEEVWRERRFTYPNVVEDTEGCGQPACAFCGVVLGYASFAVYANHFNSDGTCKNGFTQEYKCLPCGRVFETLRLACKHRVNVQCLEAQRDKARRYCEPCKHQSRTHQDHARHLTTKAHHKATHPDEFYCKDCDLRFKFKSEFDRHLQTKAHTETPNLTCTPCGVVCESKTHYDRHCAGKFHLYKVNPSLRPNLTCELCGITRPSLAQFQTHLQTAKHRKKEQESLEDPSSPVDGDASGSPDTQ